MPEPSNSALNPTGLPSILVTGDFIVDHHIYEGSRHHYGDTAQGVNVKIDSGGAGLVEKLLSKLLAEKANVVADRIMPEDGIGTPMAHHAYAFWRPVPEDAPVEKQFWRCTEAMGFGDHGRDPTSATQPPCECWKQPDKLAEKPAIVVISEGGMGFRGSASCLQSLPLEAAKLIVFKTAAPLLTGDLWKELSGKHWEKLMVVVSADELRKSSARISSGLSWESTFGDLVREFSAGGRFAGLAKCRHLIVTCGSEGAVWFAFNATDAKETQPADQEQVRFVYQAGKIEHDHAQETEGTAFGFLTCMTVALARAGAMALSTAGDPASQPFNLAGVDFGAAIEAGLAAMRNLREKGHGPATEKPDGYPISRLADLIRNPDIRYTQAGMSLAQATKSFAAPGASFLVFAQQVKGSAQSDFGRLIAIHGPIALENLPHLRIGKFMTADRTEVESLRTLAQVVSRYVRRDQGKKPLSIGVFGPPGAGKSFAVKELADELLKKKGAWLEFNLSQFSSPEDLNGSFHQVRDQVLQGKIPVAFFDEFDSSHYKWLQYLLAPVQDGRFQQGQLTHTLGKAVFIFAGGTSWTFDTFGPPQPEAGSASEPEVKRAWVEFCLAKGPDFKSRLDAFLDVVGPNRRAMLVKGDTDKYDFEIFGQRLRENPGDTWVSIRRALILRVELGLPAEQRLEIDPGLVNALLNVPRFTHGSRSFTKILNPFKAILPAGLQPSALPPISQLEMHTDAKEFRLLSEGKDLATALKPEELSVEIINVLAPKIHETYNELGIRAGWLKSTDAKSLEDYAKDKPFEAQSNYEAACRMPGILALVGLRLVPGQCSTDELRQIRQHIEYHLELLANAEHLGWMDWYFKDGWIYHPEGHTKEQRAKKRHNCLKPFTQLKEADQTKDREQVRHYPDFAKRANLKIDFA